MMQISRGSTLVLKRLRLENMEPTEIPVISTKEKKKTLSFKPKKQVKVPVLRNVYAAPSERYWPLLDDSKEADFNDLLERTLIVANLPRTKEKLPWKNLSKEERKKRRKHIDCDGEATDSTKIARSSLFLGLNAVSRALEKCETSVVLLTYDLDPPMLGHHISDLCVVKRVPLIVTRSLRQATRKNLGFSCVALGIKRDQSQCTELEEKLIELSTIFPIPDGPMYKKLDDKDDVFCDSDDSSLDEKPTKSIQEKWDPKRLKDIYLLRTSRKERVFIPQMSGPIPVPAREVPKFEGDFISFGTSDTQKSEESSLTCSQQEDEVYRVSTTLGLEETAHDASTGLTSKRKISNYMPLVVKVVQSNPDKKSKKQKIKHGK